MNNDFILSKFYIDNLKSHYFTFSFSVEEVSCFFTKTQFDNILELELLYSEYLLFLLISRLSQPLIYI